MLIYLSAAFAISVAVFLLLAIIRDDLGIAFFLGIPAALLAVALKVVATWN